MSEGRDLVQQYLDQLRLSLRIPEAGRILVEAEDHLREATAAGMAAGLTEREAQEAAISSFGSVRAVVHAHQTRHGLVAAMLADLAIALWRVTAFYLLARFALGLVDLLMRDDTLNCAANRNHCPGPAAGPVTSPLAADVVWIGTGVAGLALLAAYFIVRRFQRSRGRVWSVPLGGYFPLTAAITSVAVAAGMVMLVSSHVGPGPVVSFIGLSAVGLAVTYGGRMWRMLRQQTNDQRGWGELA